MNTITVRQAVLADLEALAHLFDQYRQFQGQASDLVAGRDFLRARFNHGESVIFLAQAGATAVGFAQLYPSFSSVALARVFTLNDLFVHESGRRKGVASALLAAIEAYVVALGAVRITLLVAKQNVSAQALYEARNWQQDEHFYMYHRYP
jgi:ribosomal protein S18 acetylase RimI-like enzyme